MQHGNNLIINGDAETDIGNWTSSPSFEILAYGSPGAPSLDSPGPVDRGSFFFAGGPYVPEPYTNNVSNAVQTIDVADGSTLIDQGQVNFLLSGYLGGYADQNDTAALTAIFCDGDDSFLGSASIGPVTNSDRMNTTGMVLRSSEGILPSGTRNIAIHLEMQKENSGPYYSPTYYNDGYADNLSLTLAPVPIPRTVWLLCSGLIGLIGVKRKFRD